MDFYSKTSYNSKFLFHHETVSKLIIFTNFSSSPPLSQQLTGVLTSSRSSEVPASIFCHNEISYLWNISVDFFLRPHREHYYYHVNIFPAWCPLSYQHAVQKVDWSLVGFGWYNGCSHRFHSTHCHVGVALLLTVPWSLALPTSASELWDQPQSLSDLLLSFLSDLKWLFVSGREINFCENFKDM